MGLHKKVIYTNLKLSGHTSPLYASLDACSKTYCG